MSTSGRTTLVVVAVFCHLIAFSHAGSISQDVPATQAGEDPFTFEDIFDSAYTVKSFSARWINGKDEFLYRDSTQNGGAVMRFDAENKVASVFIDNSTFSTLQTSTYYVSPDLNYALFAYEITSVWRHSFTARYKLLNIATNTLTDYPNDSLQGEVLQYVAWSTVGNASTFVYGNNLYYQASVSDNPVQITTSGDPTWIYNGIPDWLYEEDVLSERVSHYVSPEGRYICYAELNDTEVPLQAWPWYGSKDDVYGTTIRIPYPKAGDVRNGAPGPNTKVKLYVYDTVDGSTKDVPPVAALTSVDHYYLQVVWRNESTVMVTWANRVQNESWAVLYDVTATTLTPNLNYHYSVPGGWVEVPPAYPVFIDGGARYITVLPELLSEESGHWRHVAVVTSPMDTTGTATFLSTGEVEVDYIIGYDESSQTVYYVSTGGDPAERHLAQVLITGAQETCVTCSEPDTCRYITFQYSSTFNYYVLGCRGPDIPTYALRQTLNPDTDYFMLEDNSQLRANLANKALPTREFISVPINGGYTGRAEVFYPPGHVSGNKYPLLVYVYAGPGSQRVTKLFPMGGSTTNWLLYLKSSLNVAVVSLDGRGSAWAGDKLKFEMYRKLSVVEIADQITAGEYFKSMDHIDTNLPAAMFGWSYGGGVTAHVIGDTSKTFMCGISVAPVTTKAYYDTAYTERYLAFATPDDDEAGYNATDVMNKASNFVDKTYMIAHGTADDNVHYMHAAQLIRALSDAGVQFRQNTYMDQTHGINSYGQSRHLYKSMTNFLANDCWGTIHPFSTAAVTANYSLLSLFISLIFTLVQRYLSINF